MGTSPRQLAMHTKSKIWMRARELNLINLKLHTKQWNWKLARRWKIEIKWGGKREKISSRLFLDLRRSIECCFVRVQNLCPTLMRLVHNLRNFFERLEKLRTKISKQKLKTIEQPMQIKAVEGSAFPFCCYGAFWSRRKGLTRGD